MTTPPRSAPSITPDRFRQLRGLIIHERESRRRRTNRVYHRGLITTFPPARARDGRCRWCRRPTQNKRTIWHPECVLAYTIALGQQNMIGQRPLIPKQPCPCGQPPSHIDHITALSIAHARGDRRGIIRAYTSGNLQWLCKKCHAEKTRADMRTLANIKAGLPEDHVRERRGHGPKGAEVPPNQLVLIP